jgi:hypothetical protein
MKVPLPKQTFAYNIFNKYPTITQPIKIYFGTGSRLFPPFQLYCPYKDILSVKFRWNHGAVLENDVCSTKFVTELRFYNSSLEKTITEEIIYSIKNNYDDNNDNFQNIKYELKDITNNDIFLFVNKKNLSTENIENYFFNDVTKCDFSGDIEMIMKLVEKLD